MILDFEGTCVSGCVWTVAVKSPNLWPLSVWTCKDRSEGPYQWQNASLSEGLGDWQMEKICRLLRLVLNEGTGNFRFFSRCCCCCCWWSWATQFETYEFVKLDHETPQIRVKIHMFFKPPPSCGVFPHLSPQSSETPPLEGSFSPLHHSVSAMPNQHLRNGHLGCYRSNQKL